MALKNIGALWLKEKNGRKYFSGVVEPNGKDGPKLRVMVFKNEKKDSDKHPDYRIVTDDNAEPSDSREEPTVPF